MTFPRLPPHNRDVSRLAAYGRSRYERSFCFGPLRTCCDCLVSGGWLPHGGGWPSVRLGRASVCPDVEPRPVRGFIVAVLPKGPDTTGAGALRRVWRDERVFLKVGLPEPTLLGPASLCGIGSAYG